MNYKDFAEGLAKDAGRIMKSFFAIDLKVELKADMSPVTEADLQINELVAKAIKTTFPDHGIVSEESTEHNPQSDWQWICDPIDGTYPFSRGIPTSVFSLCLAHQSKIVLAVVYDPFLDRLYAAEQGKGTTLNARPIRVSNAEKIEGGIVGISLWGQAAYDLAPLMSEFQARGMVPINLASNIYMSSLVSAGALLGVVYNDDKLYDTAAVDLLVPEAGGQVTDLFGGPLQSSTPVKGMVATNGKVHDQFLEIIRQSNIVKK